jgi:hypothetical protein
MFRMFSFAMAFSFQDSAGEQTVAVFVDFRVEVTATYTTDRKHCSFTTVWPGNNCTDYGTGDLSTDLHGHKFPWQYSNLRPPGYEPK